MIHQPKGPQMPNHQKEAQNKLMKGLLDFIVLQLLNTQPTHGYQLIIKIRKNFGVRFGPSTIYPLLCALEKKGYIKSSWDTDTERPRKIYHLTQEGNNVLSFTENSLNLICKKLNNQGIVEPNLTIDPSGEFGQQAPRMQDIFRHSN
jgi:PadR family transcriptional regulator, regulatory protein PadR